MEDCKLTFFLFYWLWFCFNVFRWVINRFFLRIVDNFTFFYFSFDINWLLWNLLDSSWYRWHLHLFLLYLLSTRSAFCLWSIFNFLYRLNLFCTRSIRFEYFLSACSHNFLCHFPCNFIFISRRNVSRSKIFDCLFISVYSG